MKNTILSLIIFLMSGIVLTAGNHIFDVHSGLAENTVRSIIQDRTGYVWFATKDGLSRYNGSEIVNYGRSYEMEQSISLNIESLLLHEDGIKVWVAARAGLFLFDPATESFLNVLMGEGEGDSIIHDSCSSLCYDSDGNLWVGSNGGLYVRDAMSLQWKQYRSDNYPQLPSDRITSLLCDSRGILWIGTEEGLVRYDNILDNFRPISASLGRQVNVTTISEDRNGTLWVGTWSDGMSRLEIKKNHLEFYPGYHDIIRAVYHGADPEMYVCSDSGLFKFDKETGKMMSFKFEEWMPDKSYRSFFEDREGGYWIGTYFSGVCYISPKSRDMEIIRPGRNCAVGQFCEMDDNTMMVSTENYGLLTFNPKTKEVASAPFSGLGDNIHSLCLKDNDLWIGTFGEGLVKADVRTKRTVRYDEGSIPNSHVYSLCLTKDDELIIGTLRGACKYSYKTDRFARIDTLGDSFVYDIIEDNYGKIWFSSYGVGVYCLNTETGEWKQYASSSEEGSICGNNVIRLHIDSKDQLWFCTEGSGICRYDYKEDRFVTPAYGTDNGKLPDNVVYGILEDNDGNLWLSTNNGLLKYNQTTGNIHQYSFCDGVQSKQFNYKSSYKSSDGRLYFGGIDGFNAFFLNQLKDNAIRPTLSVHVSYKDHGEHVSIPCIGERNVGIPRRVRNFTLELECLSFVSPADNSFKYRFGDKEWVYTDNNQVSFINMKPGKYVMTVKAINGDGYESDNECRINLYVQPPVMASLAAIILYVVLFAVLVYLGVSYSIRMKNREMQHTLEEMCLKNEQESYDAKIRFFTQIAHEIKTPVTLIKAPLEMIRKSGKWDDDTVRNLDLIESSTDRLMSLLKELLDFKKISKDGYRLKYETVDVVILAKEATKGFMAHYNNGTPKVSFVSSRDTLICDLDPEAIIKIITNLVSNSVRYARTEVIVRLDVMDSGVGNVISLSVADDGPGVSEQEKERIFDAFYQSSSQSIEQSMSGVGLGLSLVRLLVEKHGGRISLSDRLEGGCEFCAEIPVKHVVAGELSVIETAAEIVMSDKSANDSTIRLLIVEDTEDLRNFLTGNFADSFKVTGASDGVDAINKLKEQDFDVIVSDIYMPNMDGFDLLKTVRNDNMLCHIPFILLSAEASSESKIRGLERGADSYIEKPFSMTHLKAVIENLVSNRRLLQKKFSIEPLEKHNVEEMSKYDSDWLAKLDSLINAGMSEVDFSIDKLASNMFMSRSNFQRKLKGLLNMSPNDYIKLMKLKRAAELLLEGHYKINEVCYIVGFNNPSYFASCFHKQFGMLPKDFINQNKNQ